MPEPSVAIMEEVILVPKEIRAYAIMFAPSMTKDLLEQVNASDHQQSHSARERRK